MQKLTQPVTSKALRQSFIDFFAERGHRPVPSAPVVPQDDPTLLFTNAGMNQFKSILLGGENPLGLKRAVDSQKCIRVSGKHNDLDVVGRDSYHHTFFEMLGNWSFGDYFKKEAIRWSWELLTDVWGLEKSRLWATVYEEDDEACALWKSETDIDPTHVLRFGKKENFWEMGDTGPCGPCSEIHYDFGPETDPRTGEPGYTAGVNVDGCERFIEIWNNVFMQYERLEDGSLKPLPKCNVDTGMGFERILRLLQNKKSNYDTDVFQPLIQKVAELTGVPYDPGVKGTPHRVIADHVRTLSSSIADGASPSNEGRGYVLRRILRRAARFARELGAKKPLICEVVPTFVEIMGDAYPELKAGQAHIMTVIRSEEERFGRTLDQGLERFARAAEAANDGVIDGEKVFELYDTYGFPVDLTEQMAEERGLKLDMPGYEKAMAAQRERARAGGKFSSIFNTTDGWTVIDSKPDFSFLGYDTLEAKVSCLRFREYNDDCYVVTDSSPFYAECGGQIGDHGTLEGDGVKLRVEDTVKVNETVVHRCTVTEGVPTAANMKSLTAKVDTEFRERTRRNHSSVHLLQAALRQVLGDHVHQQGSWVGPDSFRFDFTQDRALSPEELAQVESIVNASVRAAIPVETKVMGLDEAKATGAMALFSEKYGDKVRVVCMGDLSKELCGGTHVTNTGMIGLIKLTHESSVSAGVRRIEGRAGAAALEMLSAEAGAALELAAGFKCDVTEVPARVSEIQARLRTAEKEIETLKVAALAAKVPELFARGEDIAGVRVAACDVSAEVADMAAFQRLADATEKAMGNGKIVLLAAGFDGKATLLALVSQDLCKKVPAGQLVQAAAKAVDGRGGGKPQRAQAGGRDPSKLSEALVAFTAAAREKLV